MNLQAGVVSVDLDLRFRGLLRVLLLLLHQFQIFILLAYVFGKGLFAVQRPIHDSLEQLSASSTWNLLNKGTHHDSTIPEFNRNEVKGLLELVEKLSAEVEKFKVVPAVK